MIQTHPHNLSNFKFLHLKKFFFTIQPIANSTLGPTSPPHPLISSRLSNVINLSYSHILRRIKHQFPISTIINHNLNSINSNSSLRNPSSQNDLLYITPSILKHLLLLLYIKSPMQRQNLKFLIQIILL